MKKTLIATAAVLAMAGLAACGDNVQEPRTEPGAYSGDTGATGTPGSRTPGTAPDTSGGMSGPSTMPAEPSSPPSSSSPDMGSGAAPSGSGSASGSGTTP